MSEVSWVPDGYEGVTPYLICKNCESAIEFYKKAFRAEELFRIGEPGMVGHAEMKIGNAIFMLADEHAEIGAVSPETIGGSPVGLMVYVPDVDGFVEKAVAEGAEVTKPVADQFYGDRTASLKDPYGHTWYIATHKEDVDPEEMNRRAAEMHGE